MYFTLAVSASTRARCAELVSAATGTDPRVMPIPGPPAVAWRAPSELAAVVHWPASQEREPRSHAGTIWADQAELHARTGLTRVDPVYLVEVPGAVVVSDRASWAAAVAGGWATLTRLRWPRSSPWATRSAPPPRSAVSGRWATGSS